MSGKIISEIGTIMLALGMAMLVWIVAMRQEDPLLTKNFPSRVPLKIVQPAPELVIIQPTNIPADVQLNIRAPQSVWQNLTAARFQAQVDLSAYAAGVYEVPIVVNAVDNLVTVIDVSPQTIPVRLEPLVFKMLPVVAQIKDAPAIGYFNRLPVVQPVSVTVKGSAEMLNMVDHIAVDIYLNNAKETIKQTIALSARTTDDQTIPDVMVDPLKATITIPIEQRFGYKNVAVKAQVEGQPDTGYWVSSISVEPTMVTLVGGPSVLGQVTGFVQTAPIDISGATQTVAQRVSFDLPPGASILVDETQDTEQSRSALVTVVISALTGGRTIQTGLTVQGVSQGFTWTAAPETVDVIVSGPLPVLQNLTENDITVILDLFGRGEGIYRLQPEVLHPQNVDITSVLPDTIEITLNPRQSATSTPFVLPTANSIATSALTLTIPATPVSTVTAIPLITVTPVPLQQSKTVITPSINQD